MSRKNNLQTRKDAHKFELEREREALDRKKKREEERLKKLAARPSGVQKAKFKGVRIKRNRTARGIKIKDAESKRKVRDVLAAEAAMREMGVDGVAAEKGAVEGPSRRTSGLGKKKKVVIKAKGSSSSSRKGKGPEGGAMQTD